MPSNSATRVDDAPAGVRATATADRLITGLTVWWLAFPVALIVGLGIFSEPSRHAFWDGVGRALLCAGLGGAVAPAAGIPVALIGRRRRGCQRFAVMGALSITGFVLVLILRMLAE